MNDSGELRPIPEALDAPVTADSVKWPELTYGTDCIALLFLTDEDKCCRVTFEKLDSLRVSRGEYYPYGTADELPHSWVSTVQNSPWLRERYEYEARHYRDSYDWGGDVGEMLTDFKHYLFEFHDQYVEALAAGIWFETRDKWFEKSTPIENHPLMELPESTVTERFECHGLVCQVRTNPRTREEIVRDSIYCSQPLMHFAIELTGRSHVHWRLDVRSTGRQTKSILSRPFGGTIAEVDGLADLEFARPHIEPEIRDVRQRLREMGE